MLPATFRLRIDGPIDFGGEPFAVNHAGEDAARRIEAWRAGEPVGDGGALARTLVMCNLAQPVPPRTSRPPVSVVIPVRDRSIARLLAALDADDVIVVDDASADPDALRAEAEAAGARYLRRDTNGGAAAARNDGLAAARHELVACIDSDCVPRDGWLEPLLPHFADPELDAIAPRIVALEPAPPARAGAVRGEAGAGRAGTARGGGRAAAARGEGRADAARDARGLRRALARYEAAHSPLDRGPAPARVLPYGRVPFVPGAAIVLRRHLRFDATLRGGEDVELCWRVPYVRYEPASHVAHDHRTRPREWVRRRVYYGATAAGIAKRQPGKARPLHVSPWTTAAWLALAARRPLTAVAVTAAATALLARDLEDARLATRLAAGGTFRSGRVIADALTRHWWPLSLAAAIAFPRTRLPIAAAALHDPRKLPDDLAYGCGLWKGCLRERTLDPLLPARPWRLHRRELTPEPGGSQTEHPHGF
jgi:glycosyltransferase involved in cell wall biosynthesis